MQFTPDVELMDTEDAAFLLQALKMFVLAAVPLDRRRYALQLCRRMVEAHSSVDDGLGEFDAKLLKAFSDLEEWSDAWERNEPKFAPSKGQ